MMRPAQSELRPTLVVTLTRDPDVLDTWFVHVGRSALGWPDTTEHLKAAIGRFWRQAGYSILPLPVR